MHDSEITLPTHQAPDRGVRKLSLRSVIPFVVFAVLVAVWTWELLAENPVPASVMQHIPNEWRFWLAKGLHIVAYAVLTIVAGQLPIPKLHFWVVVSLLVLHGIATEVGQTYVAGRHGSIRDVLLDWSGVGIGLLAVWLVKPLQRRPHPKDTGTVH